MEAPEVPVTMAERLEAVQARIAAACARAGRDPASVTLVAVSKGKTPDQVRALAAAGQTLFGENRVQEALAKAALCDDRLEWHLIGHLQQNKVRKAVGRFTMIHSVDSVALLEKLDAVCGEAGRDMPVCLELNLAGEASKTGAAPEALPALIATARRCLNVSVVGLMTVPPWSADPEKARPFFARLRALRAACAAEHDFPVDGLSMGMSHDLEVAIEEGATWVRVGTDLFGARP